MVWGSKKSTSISNNQRMRQFTFFVRIAFPFVGSKFRGRKRSLVSGMLQTLVAPDIYRGRLDFRIIDIALPELDVDYGDEKEDNDRGVYHCRRGIPDPLLILIPPLLSSFSSSTRSLLNAALLPRPDRDSNSRSRKKVLRIFASKKRAVECSSVENSLYS